MFELTINEKVYQFHFGMGFMREINKKVGVPVDGLPDVKNNIGLQYMVAGVIDGDLEALVEVLEVANKGKTPRITRDQLDSFIDDENTDIESVFENVIDFLKSANATKKTMKTLLEAIEAEKAKQ
ncbi:MAG: hypothetical protein IKU28_04105 [Erysipelotrichaceae bacterium]|nr:hypothetical protein [Erysipelotrichaceae bacterium]